MRKTILVADDSVTIRKVVELTFADSGIRVEAVGSGREALEAIPRLRPDLLLLDVVMPDPSGYDVCRTVKASDRPVPVLLLAGTFEPFDAERARAAGADGHVAKPFESRLLVERVRRLLMGEPPAPSVSPADRPAPADDLEAVLDDLASAPGPHEAPPSAGDLDGLLEEAAAEEPARGRPPDDARAPRVPGSRLSDEDVERIARSVAALLGDRVVREVAWEVVPETAERLVRDRLRELEREETGA